MSYRKPLRRFANKSRREESRLIGAALRVWNPTTTLTTKGLNTGGQSSLLAAGVLYGIAQLGHWSDSLHPAFHLGNTGSGTLRGFTLGHSTTGVVRRQ
jgi:hypothetical protein